MLDAGVDLCDVQIAARHADPRTTMRHDRARNNLDRHQNYILAAYMASGTYPAPKPACVSHGLIRGRRPTLPMRVRLSIQGAKCRLLIITLAMPNGHYAAHIKTVQTRITPTITAVARSYSGATNA